MSYDYPKCMRKDENGVGRFLDPGTAPEPGAGKRWWLVEVVRKAVDGRGETKRRNRQSTAVFCKEEDAAAMAIRRCPDAGPGEGEVRTNIYVRPLGPLFPGHSVEVRLEGEEGKA